MTIEQANMSQLAMEVEINGSVDKVWTALTENIGEWWPAEFYAGGEAGKRNFRLEASPGGRMYEEWEEGGGVLWGTVVCVEPNARLQILGTTFPNWGGPNQSYNTWELTATESGTTLKFSEHVVGRISSAGVDEKDKGWRFLWAVLKAKIEGTAVPQWQD